MNWTPILTIVIVIAIIAVAAIVLVNKIKSLANSQLFSTAKDVANAFHEMKNMSDEGAFEEPKSVGGATQVFLSKIKKDFPQYHNDDAESEIKSVLQSYLYYKYGESDKFDSSLINPEVFRDLKKEYKESISAIKFNSIAIYGYEKSKEYATILYKCSVGFNMSDRRIETRFSIKYTNQLSEHSIASAGMKCPNCGAALSTTEQGNCPYCGVRVIKDTIMNWAITDIQPDYKI